MSSKIKTNTFSLWMCVMAALLIGLDQWTKLAITQMLKLHESKVIIPGFFELMYVQNTGAAFSFLEGGSARLFFIVLTFVALGAMLWYYQKNPNRWIRFFLVIIMAGAIGNLIDRIMFGYVRDFLLFYIFGWAFPVFNVADICVTCGFIGIVIVLFIQESRQEKKYGE